MIKAIKIEFTIPGEIVRPFKEKFPKLSNFSDKKIMTEIIKDEFFNRESIEFFNVKYYTENDINEIFKL